MGIHILPVAELILIMEHEFRDKITLVCHVNSYIELLGNFSETRKHLCQFLLVLQIATSS